MNGMGIGMGLLVLLLVIKSRVTGGQITFNPKWTPPGKRDVGGDAFDANIGDHQNKPLMVQVDRCISLLRDVKNTFGMAAIERRGENRKKLQQALTQFGRSPRFK